MGAACVNGCMSWPCRCHLKGLSTRERNIQDTVIASMKRDYLAGKITLQRFEEYVENRLQGRTPVDAEGWPLYYEPSLLDGTENIR